MRHYALLSSHNILIYEYIIPKYLLIYSHTFVSRYKKRQWLFHGHSLVADHIPLLCFRTTYPHQNNNKHKQTIYQITTHTLSASAACVCEPWRDLPSHVYQAIQRNAFYSCRLSRTYNVNSEYSLTTVEDKEKCDVGQRRRRRNHLCKIVFFNRCRRRSKHHSIEKKKAAEHQ